MTIGKDSKIFIAGHQGMLGSAITRHLKSKGFTNLITIPRTQLDLTNEANVSRFISASRPDVVFVAAAKVGGIIANRDHPADFAYENLKIAINLIHSSYKNNVKKICYLGSSCIYPKHADQPLLEEYLLTSSLEPTNEAYALAKIVGIRLCEYYSQQYGVDFISAIPASLYGPNDNFDIEGGHVIPSLIARFHSAKIKLDESVTIWGTGSPLREFLYVDDCASALLDVVQNYNSPIPINIGSGEEISIKNLAFLIAQVVNYKGKINFDHTKPDGTPRKLLNSGKIAKIGWIPQTKLEVGLKKTYEWYLANKL